MRQEPENPSPSMSSAWFTTRNLVIAFAIVEAMAIGAVLLGS